MHQTPLPQGCWKEISKGCQQSIMPVGHDQINVAHATGAQILQQTIPAILTLLRTRTEGEHFSASFQIDSQSR